MPHDLTDSDLFTDPVRCIQDGDSLNNANLEPTAQALANRTRYLQNRRAVVGSARLTASPWTNNQTFNSATFTAITGLAASLANGKAGDVLLVQASLVFWNTANLDGTTYVEVRATLGGVEIAGSRTVAQVYQDTPGKPVHVLAAFPLAADVNPAAIALEVSVHGTDAVDLVGPATLFAALLK